MKKLSLDDVLTDNKLPLLSKCLIKTFDLGEVKEIIVIHNKKSVKFNTNSYTINGFYKKIF